MEDATTVLLICDEEQHCLTSRCIIAAALQLTLGNRLALYCSTVARVLKQPLK